MAPASTAPRRSIEPGYAWSALPVIDQGAPALHGSGAQVLKVIRKLSCTMGSPLHELMMDDDAECDGDQTR